MQTRQAGIAAIIGTLLLGSIAGAGDLTGSFTLGTGYLDNPLGLQQDTPAGYLSGSLRLATVLGQGPTAARTTVHQFRLGYEGNASQFGNETDLGSMRHGLGFEYFRTAPVAPSDPRSHSLSAGLQGSRRDYQGRYGIYDYGELYSYAALRRHAGSNVLWSGFAALRLRRYGELPEESFVEPHGQLKVQRFFSSRTTLGLSVRYGIKIFNDSAASAVWDTHNLPSTSQTAARLDIAQGMSDRLGLRVRVDSRHNLSDFPYFVAEDIYDSPLLDGYAHQGQDYLVALKWLAPVQVWAELGASRGDHDYGAMLFASGAAGQTRDDVVHEVFVNLEKALGDKRGGPRLQLSGGWRDQDSTIDAYRFDGLFGATTVAWNF